VFTKRGDKKAHLEDIVLDFASNGNVVKVLNTGEPLWMEVDNLNELKAAEEFMKKHSEGVLV